jgi:hypothetical protein
MPVVYMPCARRHGRGKQRDHIVSCQHVLLDASERHLPAPKKKTFRPQMRGTFLHLRGRGRQRGEGGVKGHQALQRRQTDRQGLQMLCARVSGLVEARLCGKRGGAQVVMTVGTPAQPAARSGIRA